MATIGELKDVIRPPFANYDVVVYFGGGLFALPLIYHYFIEPAKYRFPRFSFDLGHHFANETVSALSLLFTVYLLGHIIAYCGSIFIERAFDTFDGKVSSAILLSAYSNQKNREEIVNAWVFDRFKSAFKNGRGIQNGIRLLVHLPVFPIYILVSLIGGSDFYRSRIPRHVLYLARTKLKEENLGIMSLHSQWFKTLEHCVINNNANATSRMYNYLVISGLFRSLSMMFLTCIWAELGYLALEISDEIIRLKPLMNDNSTGVTQTLGIILLYIAYGFSYSSYRKFQRRYAEEAIFAYVLAK